MIFEATFNITFEYRYLVTSLPRYIATSSFPHLWPLPMLLLQLFAGIFAGRRIIGFDPHLNPGLKPEAINISPFQGGKPISSELSLVFINP